MGCLRLQKRCDKKSHPPPLLLLLLDPGSENQDLGSGINIPDPQHCFKEL